MAVLGHAMMVDARTLDRPRGAGLASTLAEEGVAAIAFDLRGHGRSAPTARDGASWTYDDFVRHDVPAIVAAARAHCPGLRVALVGHSLAAHAGLIAAGRDPDRAPDAVVAIAANLWLPRFERSAARRAIKSALLHAWTAVSVPTGRFEPGRFGMGTDAEPHAYVKQFLDMWRADRPVSADGREDYRDALDRVRVPVLSIASTGDRLLAHPRAVDRFMRTMPHARVTERVVTRADMPRPPDHMGLVLSPECRPLWREIAEWILEGAED